MSKFEFSLISFFVRVWPPLLDHVWTNSKHINSCGKVEGVSDHEGIFVTFSIEKEKQKVEKITIRNFKNFKEENFNEELKEKIEKSNLNKLIETKNVNEATTELVTVIKTTLDIHAPLIQVIPKDKNEFIPWYNDELRTKIKLKREFLKDSRTLGKDPFKERLKKITNTINYLKKFLKQKYILEELEKAGEDAKKLWKVLNFLIGKKMPLKK